MSAQSSQRIQVDGAGRKDLFFVYLLITLPRARVLCLSCLTLGEE